MQRFKPKSFFCFEGLRERGDTLLFQYTYAVAELIV